MLPEFPIELTRDMGYPDTHSWDLNESAYMRYLPGLFNMARSIAQRYDLDFLPMNLIPPSDRIMMSVLNDNCPAAIYVRNQESPRGLHFNPTIENQVMSGIPIMRRIPYIGEFKEDIARLPSNDYMVGIYPAELDVQSTVYKPREQVIEQQYTLTGLIAADFYRSYESLHKFSGHFRPERLLDPTDAAIQEMLGELMLIDVYTLKTQVLAGKRFVLPSMELITFSPDGDAIR